MNITTADRFRSVVFHSECQLRLYTVACSRYNRCQPRVFPHILQNTFRPIGHRTVHRPLCHEYLAPDRTTFSGLSSFYTVLWHITMKAICKITEFLTCLKHATPGQPKLSLTFCKTPSGRSSTEPSTGHYAMNISPPIARLFQAYRHSTLFCDTLP